VCATIPKFLIVSGPTASGKSSFAVKLAKQLNGEIVNYDAVQFYTDFSIGAAKITKDEMHGVPHHLLDIFSPYEKINAQQVREVAVNLIKDIHNKNKLPIVVGSSGMYIAALLEGLADMHFSSSDRAQDVIADEYQKDASLSNKELWEKLFYIDKERALELHENDRMRVQRALQWYIQTGMLSSDAFRRQKEEKIKGTGQQCQAFILVIAPERSLLYQRINQRTTIMLQNGLIEETKSIIAKYGEKNTYPLQSIGYTQVCSFLNGKIQSLEELRETIAKMTRRYAKRQMTFWRNAPFKHGWSCLNTLDEKLSITENQTFLENKSYYSIQKKFNLSPGSKSLPEILHEIRAFRRVGSSHNSVTEVLYIDFVKP
jgi:tRNA dimethylallyltransferase